MAVSRDPVLKKCRALGISPMELGVNRSSKRQQRGNPRRKVSEYGLQLKEKQKAKFIYGVLEKQFRGIFQKAERAPGITGENLLGFLERRLDNVVFRMGIGKTRHQSRQLVNHGHILVNGRRVDIASYTVKAGDVVSVRQKSRSSDTFKGFAENPRIFPAWISGSTGSFEGKIERFPTREEIDVPVNETLIVELYSK